MMAYVPLPSGRYVIEADTDGERIVIPAARNLLIMCFMSAWLCAWTVGGIAAIGAFFATFHPFLGFWLVGWAVGWIWVGYGLAWMFTGREILRFEGGDLEVTHRILRRERKRLFRGQDIRQISVTAPMVWRGRNPMQVPFGSGNATGSVQFTYGGRSYGLAMGMDSAEATAIADWLRKRLPVA